MMKYKLFMVLVVFMVLLVGFSFYKLYWPIKIFKINSIHITTPEVKAGEDAIYFVDYCRYFSGNLHVFKSLDGPSLIYIPEVINNNATGCRTAEVSLNIPIYALPGTYIIKVTAEAQVNSNRRIIINYQTDSFSVVE